MSIVKVYSMSGELITKHSNVMDSKVIFTSLSSSSMIATFTLDDNGKRTYKTVQGQFIVETTSDKEPNVSA